MLLVVHKHSATRPLTCGNTETLVHRTRLEERSWPLGTGRGRESSLWGCFVSADPEETEDEPPSAAPIPKDNPYGFAIAIVTLLLTCITALVLALHSIR